MEIWKLSALMLTILALAFSVQGLSFTLNRDHWISDNWEVKTLASQVASLLKRSKSHQFYGLMGKRSVNRRDCLPSPVTVSDAFVNLFGSENKDCNVRNVIIYR
uniref:Uncharacterized protein n=1 Tax=Sinocyclocheilus rhinocerous TaxID=307959 RepID=A0A673G0V5_9TELE